LLKFSDARNFGRTATGLLLIAGPLVLTIASLISPDTDHKNKNLELAAIAAHKGSYLASGLLFLLATTLLVLAGMGLVRMFRGPRGVTAGQVAGVLLALGGTVGAGWYAFGVVEYEMVNHAGLDRAALANFLDKADSTSTILPLMILFLVGIVIGLIVLGVAAIRTRVVPLWAGILILISGPLGFFSNGAVSIVANAILLVALGTLGVTALRMSDEEWDAPRVRKTVTPAADATPAPAPAA
jgi:hypothetical protein